VRGQKDAELHVRHDKNRREVCTIPLIEQKTLDGAQFHLAWVGNTGGGLTSDDMESPMIDGCPLRSPEVLSPVGERRPADDGYKAHADRGRVLSRTGQRVVLMAG
jgi:hypothetical protein